MLWGGGEDGYFVAYINRWSGAMPQPFRATSQPRKFAATIAVRVVIDRLLKNQDPLENRNNLRPSSPHLVVANIREPRRNFAVRNSWTQEP